MAAAVSMVVDVPKGDGKHIKYCFAEGKRRGLFKDGAPVVAINTTRNAEKIKQYMVRILFVTSGDPVLARYVFLSLHYARRSLTIELDPPLRRSRRRLGHDLPVVTV